MSGDGHIHITPAYPDIRVVFLLFGNFADLVDQRQRGFKILELKAFMQEAGVRFPAMDF